MKFTDNRHVFNWHDRTLHGIPFVSFDLLDRLGVPNMYTTRYRSYDAESRTGEKGLRVALMKDDEIVEARSVLSENLQKLAEQLGSDRHNLCITHQMHTANVKDFSEEDTGYWKCISNDEPIDGIVTDVHNACLVVYGADCPSIYLVDPVHHAIGLVHAGWKGTLAKIPQVAINMMVERYGSDPGEMYAAIGPSICENCYEMGDEVYDMFSEQWGKEDADALMKRHDSGKYHLDLWKANLLSLERSGIKREHIEVTNLCTCCNTDDFYSYRAHKMENEQAALLVNRFNK